MKYPASDTPLYQEAPREHLAILRIGVFGLWLVTFAIVPLDVYAWVPPDLFTAWGIASWFPETWWHALAGNSFFLSVIRFAAVIFSLAAMLALPGYRFWASSAFVAVFVSVTIQRGFFAFVNHADLAMLYLAFLLIFVPSDRVWRLGRANSPNDDKVEESRASLWLAGFLLTVPYCFIGLHRVLEGGWEVFTGDALRHWFVVFSYQPGSWSFRGGYAVANSEILMALAKGGFFVITVLEILTPLILISTVFRRAWLAMMIPFHVATLLTMNIFFVQNMILLLCLFVDWPGIWARVAKRIRAAPG